MQELTRDEMVQLVKNIMTVAGSEEEINHWLDLLAYNTYPEVADLIFDPHYNLSAEQVVAQALEHSPILLPPPSTPE
jgi:hypothetical protein